MHCAIYHKTPVTPCAIKSHEVEKYIAWHLFPLNQQPGQFYLIAHERTKYKDTFKSRSLPDNQRWLEVTSEADAKAHLQRWAEDMAIMHIFPG